MAVILLIAISAAVISTGRAVSVFMVNGREVPIYSVERPDNKIALTFDCAWGDEDIDAVLSVLETYGCKATFFVTGNWAQRCGGSLAKIYLAGHEIGNHSYNHSDYTRMNADEIIADLDKGDDAIASVTGEKPYLMRAPSGGYNDTVIRAVDNSGRTYIQWSVDGIDYGNTTEQEIYDRSVKNTSAGDIILLHTGAEYTADVLPKIIEALECKYEFCTISELIYSENYTIDNTGRQFHK